LYGWGAFWWGLAAAGLLVLFMISADKDLLGFLILGGIVTILCSLSSIASPGEALLWLWADFTNVYGAYVSLAGGTLILVGVTYHDIDRIRDWTRKWSQLGHQDQYSGD
jgi:hypothetical protein